MKRNRLRYLAGTGLVVALGLASRRYPALLPDFISRYAGDTLLAVMVFGILGTLATRWSSLRVATVTLCVSYAVELSQLYHAPWIDGIRATRLGGLVLGIGFLWSDIVCYTVGVALCVAVERWF